jgi:hypothetical protein
MKAQRKISYTVTLENGENSVYMADNKTEMVLQIAALKKYHGQIYVSNIEVSKVLVIEFNGRTTVIAKAS